MQRRELGQIINISPDELISIDSSCTCLIELQAELSRPRRVFTANGKIKVEPKADMKKRGVDSPNLADALIMAMSVVKPPERENLSFDTEVVGWVIRLWVINLPPPAVFS